MSLSVEYNTLLDKADRVLRLIINGSINANDDIDVSIINKISKLPNWFTADKGCKRHQDTIRHWTGLPAFHTCTVEYDHSYKKCGVFVV